MRRAKQPDPPLPIPEALARMERAIRNALATPPEKPRRKKSRKSRTK